MLLSVRDFLNFTYLFINFLRNAIDMTCIRKVVHSCGICIVLLYCYIILYICYDFFNFTCLHNCSQKVIIYSILIKVKKCVIFICTYLYSIISIYFEISQVTMHPDVMVVATFFVEICLP